MITDVRFEDSNYSNDIINQSISNILADNTLLSFATVDETNKP